MKYDKTSLVISALFGGYSGMVLGWLVSHRPVVTVLGLITLAAICVRLDVKSQRKRDAEWRERGRVAAAHRKEFEAFCAAYDAEAKELTTKLEAQQVVDARNLRELQDRLYVIKIVFVRSEFLPMTPAKESAFRQEFDLACNQALRQIQK